MGYFANLWLAAERDRLATWLHFALPFLVALLVAGVVALVRGGWAWASLAGLVGFMAGVTLTNILDGTRSNVGLIERRRR